MHLPPALLDAIHAAPDEAESYLVAADWLQQQGDRQGELIALSIALEAAPDDTALALLVDEHQHALDPVARFDPRWSRDWRWGFLRRLEVPDETTVPLRTLLAEPACQCLRELVVKCESSYVGRAIDALVEHAAALRSLRSLALSSSRATWCNRGGCFPSSSGWRSGSGSCRVHR